LAIPRKDSSSKNQDLAYWNGKYDNTLDRFLTEELKPGGWKDSELACRPKGDKVKMPWQSDCESKRQ